MLRSFVLMLQKIMLLPCVLTISVCVCVCRQLSIFSAVQRVSAVLSGGTYHSIELRYDFRLFIFLLKAFTLLR